MLDKELEFTLNMAFKDAQEKRHEFVTVEHLLLALLNNNSSAIHALNACGADVQRVRDGLAKFIAENTPIVASIANKNQEVQPNLGFQRVLQRAVFHVQSSGKRAVKGANILVAIYSEQDCQAVHFLKREGIARLDIVSYLTHGAAKKSKRNTLGEEEAGHLGDEKLNPRGSEEGSAKDSIEQYTTNLNEKAQQGNIDPLIGRQEEIFRTIQIL
jgi:ATP-dependent Clp protease ATP-binding subunit ClpA